MCERPNIPTETSSMPIVMCGRAPLGVQAPRQGGGSVIITVIGSVRMPASRGEYPFTFWK